MSTVKVKLGSAAYVEAANIGYGIGLDEDGHVVEFEADWEKLGPPRLASTLRSRAGKC